MKAPVAIEISERYLKLAAGEFFVRQRNVSDCVVRPIWGLDDKKITETIAGVLKGLKVTPKPLIVSMPRNQVTVRNLHLPSRDKKEIEQMLQLHIGRIVPYKKEEIVFNYLLLGTDEMDYTKVVLAIVHRDIIKRQLKILEAADLSVDMIYLSSYGVREWILDTQKSEINPSDSYLILDVDSGFTDFIIFNREHLLFNRSITIEAKKDAGQPENTKLIGEARQSLVIFHNEESNKRPAKAFLCGAALSAGLAKMVEEELEIPAKYVPAPHLQEVSKAKKWDIPPDASVTAVFQLALEDNDKRISFSMPEMQIRRSLKDRTKELTILGTLVIYFLTIMMLFFWGRFYNHQTYLKMLSKNNKLIEKDVGSLLEDYKRIEFIKDFLSRRKLALVFVSELQKIIPQQIAVSFLNIDESNKVTLRGEGAQLSDVFKFITTLDNSKYFKDTSTRYTRTKKISDREVTNFEIVFQFTAGEQQPKSQKGEKPKTEADKAKGSKG